MTPVSSTPNATGSELSSATLRPVHYFFPIFGAVAGYFAGQSLREMPEVSDYPFFRPVPMAALGAGLGLVLIREPLMASLRAGSNG